jgi:hypothetical protein
MNEQLYQWLENEWRYSNHIKYQKYFKVWVKNLTKNQIFGFQKAMESSIIGSMIVK